jgi:hypothetical protein
MCSQCSEKPAIGEVAGQPLCVDCYTKLQNAHVAEQNARTQHMRHLMSLINYYGGLMDSISGLGPLSPPIQIPSMPATGPVTLNNIKLDNSVVGAINTGNARDIDVNLDQLRAAGLDKLGDAIGALTQALSRNWRGLRRRGKFKSLAVAGASCSRRCRLQASLAAESARSSQRFLPAFPAP